MAEYTLFPSQLPDRDDATESPADAFARGACPWCDKQDFSRPKSHARNAHPKAYDAWSEAEA